MGQAECCEAVSTPSHLMNPGMNLKFMVIVVLFRTSNKIQLKIVLNPDI